MKRQYLQQGEHSTTNKKTDAQTKKQPTMTKKVETDDVGPDGRREDVLKDYGNITSAKAVQNKSNGTNSTPPVSGLTNHFQQQKKDKGLV